MNSLIESSVEPRKGGSLVDRIDAVAATCTATRTRNPFLVLVLDQALRPKLWNLNSIARLAALGCGVSTVDGRLVPLRRDLRAVFDAAACSALQPRAPTSGGVDLGAAFVRFIPLGRTDGEDASGSERRCVAVLGPHEPVRDLACAISALPLSRAESRLLRALCTDSTLRTYADATGLAGQTVRTQTKSVHAKLGVHKQLEAVRLVYRFLTFELQRGASGHHAA